MYDLVSMTKRNWYIRRLLMLASGHSRLFMYLYLSARSVLWGWGYIVWWLTIRFSVWSMLSLSRLLCWVQLKLNCSVASAVWYLILRVLGASLSISNIRDVLSQTSHVWLKFETFRSVSFMLALHYAIPLELAQHLVIAPFHRKIGYVYPRTIGVTRLLFDYAIDSISFSDTRIERWCDSRVV